MYPLLILEVLVLEVSFIKKKTLILRLRFILKEYGLKDCHSNDICKRMTQLYCITVYPGVKPIVLSPDL